MSCNHTPPGALTETRLDRRVSAFSGTMRGADRGGVVTEVVTRLVLARSAALRSRRLWLGSRFGAGAGFKRRVALLVRPVSRR
jgi:hypothetical protein